MDLTVRVSGNFRRRLRQLDREIEKQFEELREEAGDDIADRAKVYHRYKRRSGNLARATTSKTVRDVAKAYVDDLKAPYGKYIHAGFRGWSADRFLDKALDWYMRKQAEDDADKAAKKAVRKAGMQ